MPIRECDPWRYQYFEQVICPDDVIIPTDDPDCWLLFPQQRWVYNKLLIAESQGLPCGPHGILPQQFPVFSKPIVNLKGMGTASRVISDAHAMAEHEQAGHMWMQLLVGEHVSTDCAVLNGAVCWTRHATGSAGPGGTFTNWVIEAARKPALEEMLADWIKRHMGNYCGMMNFETIDGRIIETHLRFADQWCDLYGDGWLQALVRLYAEQRWDFDDGSRKVGYSIPLFAQHGTRFKHPSAAVQAQIRSMPQVKSLQITFHEDIEADAHAMPPGGFRLAVINATDLRAGLVARDELVRAFPSGVMI